MRKFYPKHPELAVVCEIEYASRIDAAPIQADEKEKKRWRGNLEELM